MSFESYLKSISKIPVLSEEEEQQLTQDYALTKNPQARDKLIKHNMRLVLKAAHRHNMQNNLPDLVQEGCLGIIQGLDRYDPDKGVRFANYIYYWIRAKMLRYVVNNAHLVKLGTTQAQRKIFFNLKKTKAAFKAQGIELTEEELAAHLKVKPEELREMEQRMSSSAISLSEPEANDREAPSNYLERNRTDILIEESHSPLDLVQEKRRDEELRLLLSKFSSQLSGRDQEIFSHRIFGSDTKTLRELGEEFNLTRERIRQIETGLKDRINKLLKRNNITY
jgi:RNA polymerase sigma-32 factor